MRFQAEATRLVVVSSLMSILVACTTGTKESAFDPREGVRAPSAVRVFAVCTFGDPAKGEYVRLYSDWIDNRDKVKAGIRPPCQEETSYFILKNPTPGSGQGLNYELPEEVALEVLDDRTSGGAKYCWGEDLPTSLLVEGRRRSAGDGSKAPAGAKLVFKSGKEFLGDCRYNDML